MAEVMYATFQLETMMFGLDVAVVQEVLSDQVVEPVPRTPEGVLGILSLRGRVLAVTDVRSRMGLPPAVVPDPAYFVVRDHEGSDVLRVDAAGDVLTLDDRARLPVPETTPAAIAALLLGAHEVDSHLLLVVDLNRMLHTADDWVAMSHDGPGH